MKAVPDALFPDSRVVEPRRENAGGLAERIDAKDVRRLKKMMVWPTIVVATCTEIFGQDGQSPVKRIARHCAKHDSWGLFILASQPWEAWEAMEVQLEHHVYNVHFFAAPHGPELAEFLGVLASPSVEGKRIDLRNGLCVVRDGVVVANWTAPDDAPSTPHDLSVLDR